MRPVVAGIDLGSSRRRSSTALSLVDLRDKRLVGLHSHISRADGIQGLLPQAEEVAAIAIDCPLSKPQGADMWRACEKTLHAEGIPIFPSGAPWTRDWVDLGIALADQLTTLRYVPVEVYPFASRLGLGIGLIGKRAVDKHTSKGRTAIVGDLERLGLALGRYRGMLTSDHDALDSVICAYTGLLWANKSDIIRDIGETRPFALPRVP